MVLVRRPGTYAWRHDSTEARFGEIVAEAGEASPLVEALGLYIDMAKERNICDYDRLYPPSLERAGEIQEGARRFFEIVKAVCGFGRATSTG